MALMDEQTGQLLNYKQLMRDPKYKKNWSTSSANEFGILANGAGGRIKNPTNTIKFIGTSPALITRGNLVPWSAPVVRVLTDRLTLLLDLFRVLRTPK